MKKVFFPITVLLLFVLAACGGDVNPETIVESASNAAEEALDTVTVELADKSVVHWSYEGEAGPAHWADLEIADNVCGTGMAQSPIDLSGAAMTDLENIAFNYGETAVTIENNGHTIQVTYDKGSNININGETYDLVQFHFHAPSEHTIDGIPYPAEMHLVHQNPNSKQYAVVGILITEGAENPAFTPVWDNLPEEETAGKIATGATISAANLLPAEQVVYRYTGSLTTPPCSEGVLWSVMQSPVEMSAEQIATFTNIFEGTNRPVQALNDRDLRLDETP